MPLMQILVIAKETGGKSCRADIPRAIQQLTLPAIAGVARLRGFRASH
jgi:hypothetical protein